MAGGSASGLFLSIMSPEQQQLLTLAADLEAQRALLGDAVVDPALAAVRTRLNALAGDVAGVDAVDAHQQTLKQLTIVFLDVVGSTRLSQHLDPEEIHAVMDGVLAACTAIVEVMAARCSSTRATACFPSSAPTERAKTTRSVRPRGPRAVRRRAASGRASRRAPGMPASTRASASIPAVLLGSGVDAEGSIHGIAVNIAARMEQSAPPGGLRISRDTYRHVRDLFDVSRSRR